MPESKREKAQKLFAEVAGDPEVFAWFADLMPVVYGPWMQFGGGVHYRVPITKLPPAGALSHIRCVGGQASRDAADEKLEADGLMKVDALPADWDEVVPKDK